MSAEKDIAVEAKRRNDLKEKEQQYWRSRQYGQKTGKQKERRECPAKDDSYRRILPFFWLEECLEDEEMAD